eukprot:SAG31_NODE_948_length_10825_cov_9.412829_13_plen_123_part_00
MHYQSTKWFAPVRIECNTVVANADRARAASSTGAMHSDDCGGKALAKRNCSFEPNVDYASSDMRQVSASTQQDCCAKCSKQSSCATGVFVAKDHACWLKTFADMKHKVRAVAFSFLCNCSRK